MTNSRAAVVLGCVCLLITGCGETATGGGAPSPSPSPSAMPGDAAEHREGFEELSGLILPDNAANMEIEATETQGRPYYEIRFVTTRGGAEVVCTADNLGVYTAQELPGEEERQVFDYREDDAAIAETVRCEGSNPEQPRVQRMVSVVFPEDGLKKGPDDPDGEDTAVVYAYSVLWPKR